MQLQFPFSVLTPTADADVLNELARAPAGRPYALPAIVRRIPDRSRSGIVRVLDRLVEQGIVLYDDLGGVKTYQLNHDHLLADAVLAISRSRDLFLRRLRTACEEIPVSYAALFGSAARGEMRPDSDIDLFFAVAPEHRDAADDRIFDLVEAVHGWTGNQISPVVYDAGNIGLHDPLIASIDAEGIPLTSDRQWLRARLRTATS